MASRRSVAGWPSGFRATRATLESDQVRGLESAINVAMKRNRSPSGEEREACRLARVARHGDVSRAPCAGSDGPCGSSPQNLAREI